ncbi:unnamed protein product [Alopecurus aequalis]
MAATQIPPESLPRRSPAGGLQPIIIHVRPSPEETPSSAAFDILVENVPRRSTPSALQWPLEPADVESLKALLNTTTLGEKSSGSTCASSSPSPRESDQDIVMASPSSGSRIWPRLRHDWGFMYYIRVDIGGYSHTYPHAGGPFQRLEEAESAMDRYFHEHRDPTLLMNQGGVPSVEITIEKAIYWPDGRRRKRSKSLLAAQAISQMRRLVQALVDKHNDDHKLFGDLAYELKDVVHYQRFYEKPTWFYHLNFTMTKVARDFNCGEDNLFFAEVKCVSQGKQDELYVSCFCMVQPTKNGHCHGCTRNGNIDMKHPGGVDEYIGGHLDRGLPLGCYSEWSDSDDDVEAKKKEIRLLFTGTDDPNVKTILWMHPDDVPLPLED